MNLDNIGHRSRRIRSSTISRSASTTAASNSRLSSTKTPGDGGTASSRNLEGPSGARRNRLRFHVSSKAHDADSVAWEPARKNDASLRSWPMRSGSGNGGPGRDATLCEGAGLTAKRMLERWPDRARHATLEPREKRRSRHCCAFREAGTHAVMGADDRRPFQAVSWRSVRRVIMISIYFRAQLQPFPVSGR